MIRSSYVIALQWPLTLGRRHARIRVASLPRQHGRALIIRAVAIVVFLDIRVMYACRPDPTSVNNWCFRVSMVHCMQTADRANLSQCLAPRMCVCSQPRYPNPLVPEKASNDPQTPHRRAPEGICPTMTPMKGFAATFTHHARAKLLSTIPARTNQGTAWRASIVRRLTFLDLLGPSLDAVEDSPWPLRG